VGGDVWLGDAPKRSICKRPPISWLSWRTVGGPGLIKLEGRYATAQPALMERAEEFESAGRRLGGVGKEARV